jgi:hypothetical protein
MSGWDASFFEEPGPFFEVPEPEEPWRQFGFDPLDLDDATADRILDGLDPDDAPPGYVSVSQLLVAATGPPRPDELKGEAAAVAAFTLENLSLPPSKHSIASRVSNLTRNKLSSLAVAGGLVLGGGMAAAATGALHGSVERVAADVLSALDIEHPHSKNDHHHSRPGTSEKPATHPLRMQTSPVPQSQASLVGLAVSGSTRGAARGGRVSPLISSGSGTVFVERAPYHPTARTVGATAPRGSDDVTNSYGAGPRGARGTKANGPSGKAHGPNGNANGVGTGPGANHPFGPQANGRAAHTTGSGSSQPSPGTSNASRGGPAVSADPRTAGRDLSAVTGQYAVKPGHHSTPASTSSGAGCECLSRPRLSVTR